MKRTPHLPPRIAQPRDAQCARWIVASMAGLLLCGGPAPIVVPTAHATEFVVEAGESWSGRSSLASSSTGYLQAVSERTVPFLRGRLVAQPSAVIGYVAGRDPKTYDRDSWLIGAGLRITGSHDGKRRWFWESFLLLSPQDTPSLSGHLQFANGFGYTQAPWEIKIRHISNAGLREPNHGETMLLVGYRF